MSLLYESLKIENRKPVNIFFHNERLNKSRRDIFNASEEIDLEKYLNIPENIDSGIYKCRVYYELEIERIEFIRYERRAIRSFKLVDGNDIEYGYKYCDRTAIDKLKEKYAPAPEEDILIVKRGLITESSFANVVLFDGIEWFTPAKPLLPGTQRAKLLFEKKIKPRDIATNDLKLFSKIKIINALVEFENSEELPVSSIVL